MSVTRLPAWAYLVIGLAPILAVLLLGDGLPRQVALALSGVATLWAVALTVYHWKRLDEAARAAHRWAWYWGGSTGLAAAMIFAGLSLTWPELQSVFTSLAQNFDSPKRSPEQAYLFLGVAFTGVAQGVGFLGAWLYWWIAKR
jgi:hypothetical protein